MHGREFQGNVIKALIEVEETKLYFVRVNDYASGVAVGDEGLKRVLSGGDTVLCIIRVRG